MRELRSNDLHLFIRDVVRQSRYKSFAAVPNIVSSRRSIAEHSKLYIVSHSERSTPTGFGGILCATEVTDHELSLRDFNISTPRYRR